VYLTDGLPTQDTEADTAIQALPDFKTDGSWRPPTWRWRCVSCQRPETVDGRCMVNLAGYYAQT
jgi:hypothetical protein